MATYHWILTLNGHTGPDTKEVTFGGRGVVDVASAETRESVTDRLIEEVQAAFLARTGQLIHDANIVFFSLEPNELP